VALWGIVKNKYGMLILGLIALGAGIFMLTRTDVTCGGEVMQAGDVCEHSKAGITTATKSTEEEKSNQRTGGMVLTGLGGALTLGGAGWIVVSLTRRKPEQAQPGSPVAAG
jgi:hypothetical protein